MHIPFTNRDAFTLLAVLTNSLRNVKAKAKFNYAVSRNKRILTPVVESLQEAERGDADIQKYFADRDQLARTHAKKDDTGRVVMAGNGMVQITDPAAFNAELAALVSTVPGMEQKLINHEAQVGQLMQQPCEVVLLQVSIEDIPDQLEGGVFDALLPMVSDPVVTTPAPSTPKSPDRTD